MSPIMLRCSLCQNHYDPETQTTLCPHEPLIELDATSGHRLLSEDKNRADAAFAGEDLDTLLKQFHGSNLALKKYVEPKVDELLERRKAKLYPE